MAIASTRDPQRSNGQLIRTGTITFDASYPTNGEAITAADVGLSVIRRILCHSRSGYVVAWNGSTSAPKLVAYRQTAASSALVEVPNTTDLSATVVDFVAYGY